MSTSAVPSALFPYTTLFRSTQERVVHGAGAPARLHPDGRGPVRHAVFLQDRSEEHTSELQSLRHLVCPPQPYPLHSFPTRRSSDLPKKELSMELRLLLAFILMGVVLFVTPYFYKTVAPPVKKTAPAATKSEPAPAAPGVVTAPAETAPAADSETAASETAAPPVVAGKEETRVIETDKFRITFSNRGAVVKSWLLKEHKEHSGAPLQLVNTASHADPPASLYFPAQKPAVDLNLALYEVHTDADGLAISFDYSNGKVVVHKSFQFRKSSYLLDVSTEVTESGKPLPHQIEWRGGFGDLAAVNPAGEQQTLYFDATEAKLKKSAAKAAKDGPVTVTGNYSFAGVEDKYFVAAYH